MSRPSPFSLPVDPPQVEERGGASDFLPFDSWFPEAEGRGGRKDMERRGYPFLRLIHGGPLPTRKGVQAKGKVASGLVIQTAPRPSSAPAGC